MLWNLEQNYNFFLCEKLYVTSLFSTISLLILPYIVSCLF